MWAPLHAFSFLFLNSFFSHIIVFQRKLSHMSGNTFLMLTKQISENLFPLLTLELLHGRQLPPGTPLPSAFSPSLNHPSSLP